MSGKNDSTAGISVKFKCPNCLKSDIIRTAHERAIGAKYECKGCGFSGPN